MLRLYFDRQKDKAMVIIKKKNTKFYRNIITKEYINFIQYLESKWVSYTTPKNGTALEIKKKYYSFF